MSKRNFVRAYLRASTDEQDASRARDMLDSFAKDNGQAVACWYIENASGASAERAELTRLLNDAQHGDVLLVESIDRLSRLPAADWQRLRAKIDKKGVRVVAIDLPTSHAAMGAADGDEFTARMLDAINSMMLDMMAAIARKDYEQRRERQAQGIAQAKAKGKYRGRPQDNVKRDKIRSCLAKGMGVRETARITGTSPATVSAVKKEAAQ